MSKKKWCILTLNLVILFVALPAQAQREDLSEAKPTVDKVGGFYSYAVKFVCGFNRSNLGIDPAGVEGGEAPVKIGNYATEVNIYNPSLVNTADITKKVIFLVKEGEPVGREPNVVGPSGFEVVRVLPCTATMDDCPEILRIGGIPTPPGTLPILTVGFLVLQSPVPLDVTAVYTAEICSDFVVSGSVGMCQTVPGIAGVAAYGAGISIDVEQIEGKYIQ